MKFVIAQPSLVKLICAVVLAVTVCSCSAENGNQAEKAATAAARTWLAAIDEGAYAQTWTNAATGFKSAVTSEKWTDSMQRYRKPLGSLISRTVKSAKEMSSLPGAPDGDYVVMQFESSFAEKKSAIETVTFLLEKDGQWRAAGYYIK
jgi:hypothetical protein